MCNACERLENVKYHSEYPSCYHVVSPELTTGQLLSLCIFYVCGAEESYLQYMYRMYLQIQKLDLLYKYYALTDCSTGAPRLTL